MLPPAPMLAIKNEREDKEWRMENGKFRHRAGFHLPSSICHLRFLVPLALALFLSGCSPSGPHALLKGKKFVDRGDYAGAVAQLKIATSLLVTNAQAWNYLGLAYHHADPRSESRYSMRHWKAEPGLRLQRHGERSWLHLH